MNIFSRLANVRVIVLIIFVAYSLISKAEDASGKYNDKKILAEVQDISNSGVIAAQEATLDGLTYRSVKVGDLYYIVNVYTNEAYVTSSENYQGLTEVEIVDQFDFFGNTVSVVAIGEFAFHKVYTLKKVKIPDSVTIIKKYAFAGCGLTDIDFGNGVEVIEEYAFEGAKFKEIRIPESVIFIGGSAFSWNPILESIETANSDVTIEGYAFSFCSSLKCIKFGKSVSSLGDKVFYECNKMETVLVDEENPYYTSIDGVLYTKDGRTLVYWPAGRDKGTPSDSTTKIGDWAFINCKNLTEIIFPESLIEIGEHSFENCYNLKYIEFGDNLETIGKNAFFHCTKLETVKFGQNLKTIGESAFEKCESLQSLSFGPNLQYLDIAFPYCNALTSVSFTSKCPLLMEEGTFGTSENIKNVYVDCSQPPEQTSGWTIFHKNVFSYATLYVPEKDFYLYYKTFPWSLFKNREILENVGVDAIPDSNGQNVHTVYTIDGKLVMTTDDPDLLDTLPSGLYIINGKKTLIK